MALLCSAAAFLMLAIYLIARARGGSFKKSTYSSIRVTVILGFLLIVGIAAFVYINRDEIMRLVISVG